MDLVIRVCDENGNKYTGFELCKRENILKLFPHGVYKGSEFNIGRYKYSVQNIQVVMFGERKMARDTLDGGTNEMGDLIWICCKTDDPRIKEGNINEETQSSVATDLMLT